MARTLAAVATAGTLIVTIAGCTGAKSPAGGQGDGAATAATASAAGPSGTASSGTPSSGASGRGEAALADAVRPLEQRHGGTAGVYAIDTETGRSVGYRAGERFGFASTHKALTAAAVLATADSDGADSGLDTSVKILKSDVVANSPKLGASAGKYVKLRDVIGAAIRASDNTAGNVLFRLLGGPAQMQSQLRAMGDKVTSVSHNEPGLNDWKPGQRADSTTPEQAATDLRAVFQGGTLTAAQQKVLLTDMRAVTTGDKRIRAAVKALGSSQDVDTSGWKVADKTGTAGESGQAGVHDIARIDRPGAKPIFITVYTYKSDPSGATSGNADEDFLAQTAAAALRTLDP